MKLTYLLCLLFVIIGEISAQTLSGYVDLNAFQRVTPTTQTTSDNIYAFANDIFNSLTTSTMDLVINSSFWTQIGNILSSSDNNYYSAAKSDLHLTSIHNLMQSVFGNIVIQVPCSYISRDIAGDTIRLSGKLYLPANGTIKQLIVANHYTIGSNKECPSEIFCFESIFAAKGYAVLMADYIGYGITKQYIHPYLHRNSTAQSVVDMLLLAPAYLRYIKRIPISDKIILLGYSQGAAVTLQVQELIERCYAHQITIQKVYAGAGPYDLQAQYDYCVKTDLTGIPCAIPMLVQGMNIGEKLGLDIQQFFQEPLRSMYPEWINSKEYTINTINWLIQTNRLTQMLTPMALDINNPHTAKIYDAMKKNSIVDYTPIAPIYLFHSITDDMVPFINSVSLRNSFEQHNNIQYDIGNYGTHMNGAVEFIKRIYNQLP